MPIKTKNPGITSIRKINIALKVGGFTECNGRFFNRKIFLNSKYAGSNNSDVSQRTPINPNKIKEKESPKIKSEAKNAPHTVNKNSFVLVATVIWLANLL